MKKLLKIVRGIINENENKHPQDYCSDNDHYSLREKINNKTVFTRGTEK